MLTLDKFEHLVAKPLTKRAVSSTLITSHEAMTNWSVRLLYSDKHEQYGQVKAVVRELIVADLSPASRFVSLELTLTVAERLIAQMQNEYIHNPQSASDEQKTCINEVRSLYFLLILAYQAIAFDTYEQLQGDVTHANKHSWLKKLTGGLSANVVRNGVSLGVVGEPKRLFTMAVYRLMALCYKLGMEFALTYQKSPQSFWQLLNSWYLKSAVLQVDKLCVSQLGDNPPNTIHQQYLQSCLASFTNLFAYRRVDILQVFKILPTWVNYVQTTFTPDSDLRLFVNLQAATPPELISPYASVNPYKEEHVCLFFSVQALFQHLQALEHSETMAGKSAFEGRLATMVLLAFYRQSESDSNASLYTQSAVMVVGFGAIFKKLTPKHSFNQVIAQSQLKDSYRPKRLFGVHDSDHEEQVRLIRRSDSGAQFIIGAYAQTETGENKVLNRPYLPVFSLFAMKSPKSNHKYPWRLGIVHWAEGKAEHVEVDGRFLGRILSACGIRLNTRDMRSQEFVQAFLIAGDELSQQTTLILPRYHFKAGDTVILRLGVKETALRLERNVLTTDEIEQYQIVRL